MSHFLFIISRLPRQCGGLASCSPTVLSPPQQTVLQSRSQSKPHLPGAPFDTASSYSKEKFTKTLSLRPLPLRFPLDMYELNDCSGVLNMVRSNMDAVLINICIFGRHTYKNHMGVNSQTNPGGGGESAICLSKQSVLGAQKSLVYARPPEAFQVALNVYWPGHLKDQQRTVYTASCTAHQGPTSPQA